MKQILFLFSLFISAFGHCQNQNSEKDTIKAQYLSKDDLSCNEEGKVVLQISVDREGEVIDSKVIEGTTNFSDCLIKMAYERVKKMKFLARPDAPEIEIGQVVLNFKIDK